LIVKKRMNPLRTARTLALMNAAVADAGICTWDVKFLYYFPRPSQVDPSIKTATGLPNFPAYTSGHATFSAAASTVLSYIFPEEKSKLEAMAVEAANSRVYGGIHYRFDSEVGLQCGKNIAAFAVERGIADGSSQ
jgi:membrane-associated phospholipid phosphatase